MWAMIQSLLPIVEPVAPAFTQPSFTTGCQLLLAWVMCLGRHTLYRVGETISPQTLPDHTHRHHLDSYYNFFERSAWTPRELAHRVGLLILTKLSLFGTITLLVDDTLAHKRGQSVWGLGWFRDAVASTHKRVATASGHNWVRTDSTSFSPEGLSSATTSPP
jgi:DDE superfamily endonuclease